jgi:putative methionine-R-sulfoxide reductase with GAF domain
VLAPGSRRCLLGTVTAGIWMDNQELQRLAASTLDADLTRDPRERARLVVSIPATPTTAGVDSRLLAIVLLGLVVCLAATLLGSVLARLVSRSGGRWAGWPVPSSACGSSWASTSPPCAPLRSSRDELARSMNRLGETLSSTHDLPKLLAVVLEAAVQARRAKAGSLLLLTADRTALIREATHGLAHRDPAERIPVGQGVAGTVAATRRAMVLASPAGNGGPEPTATTQVSVPVAAQGRVLGVLSLYDREDGEPFTLADTEAMTAFAVQAAVAIENVQLHAEPNGCRSPIRSPGPGTTATSSAASSRRSSGRGASAGSWPCSCSTSTTSSRSTTASGTSAVTRCWSSSPAGSPAASATSTPSPATAARSSC